MLNEDFTYPRFAKSIRHQLAACDICQRTKCAVQTSYANMQTIVPSGPGDLVSIDFYGPLPVSTGGVRHILVTLDAFSKYVVLYPMRKANTKTVIDKMEKDYLPKYGKPRRIQFDHGTQFTAKAWEKWLLDQDIKGVFSSIRHPQGNIVERVNRELGRFFRTLLQDKHTGWAKWVPIIQDCINESPHDTTEYTPKELQLEKVPHRPWKNWIPALRKTAEEMTSYARKLEIVQGRILQKGRRRAEKFDACHRTTTYEEGDLVLVKALNVSNVDRQVAAKFLPLYEGPYSIQKCVGLATYLLVHPATGKERGKFHASLLRRYYDPKHPREIDSEEE